jgi:two-component system CheB/CheR fusion protein
MSENTSPPTSSNPSEIRLLIGYLKRTRGIDYASYKHTTLERRFRRRMQTLNLESYDEYIDYLEVHPDEFRTLFNTVLINMTDFFRDAPSWEAIRTDIVPRILAEKKPEDSVRVWSAGCASGQEAYTIAIILSEAMGEAAFRQQAKIYATDVDEEALNEARLAVYSADQLKSVPAELREKYFEPSNGNYAFKKELRRSVIFGKHDLLQDAPISRIDLLICRNTLMYFNAEAQARILSRFAFALNDAGYLFLGKAEIMAARINAFTPADLKSRVFAKVPNGLRASLDDSAVVEGNAKMILDTDDAILRDLALEADPVPQLVLNARNEVVFANGPARMLFEMRSTSRRQRLQDLLIAYRPVDLRHMIEQVNTERATVQQRDIKWTHTDGSEEYFDVAAVPLIDAAGILLGVKIAFTDVTLLHKLRAELLVSHREMETLNEELQSSNEELETTNEELQSTNEELETTNEELQSTNEELETMNEELQSTNEELETVNEELRKRGQDLNRVNAFLESIMYGIRECLIVLDRNLTVRAWNRMAEDMWGLRLDEVTGQHFFNLDIGLPVDQLGTAIRGTLADGNWDKAQEVVLPAVNRRGRSITVGVTTTPLLEGDNTRQGVILVVKELEQSQTDGTGGNG